MTYVDNRDWPEYNAQLVRRGEFYLDLSCVKNWSWELRVLCRIILDEAALDAGFMFCPVNA